MVDRSSHVSEHLNERVGGSSLSSPVGSGWAERDVCWREACRVISFHPVLMLR